MRRTAILVGGFVLLLAPAGQVFGWSLCDEITLLDANLSVQCVWEDTDAVTLCDSIPPADLDRVACEIRDPDEFWFGLDGAGDAYGVIGVSDAGSTYFDVHRRPAGTRTSVHIIRITQRTELIPGEVTKLFLAGRWQVDVAQGDMLFNLRGSCSTAACVAQGDVKEHLALVRVSGIPALLDVALSYDPSGTVSINIPALPEGLPTGDFFDLYAGDVATLPDLSLAQTLACNFAAGLSPGDTAAVADPLPDPPANQARYYLAAVTGGTERRAGRERINGVLQARDASGLPLCP